CGGLEGAAGGSATGVEPSLAASGRALAPPIDSSAGRFSLHAEVSTDTHALPHSPPQLRQPQQRGEKGEAVSRGGGFSQRGGKAVCQPPRGFSVPNKQQAGKHTGRDFHQPAAPHWADFISVP
ncbi:hypothetical protein KUCAC02_007499, partial [Chaenocephalus aceratus]